MDDIRLKYLLVRFNELKCTDDELEELNDWYHSIDGGSDDLLDWISESGGREQLTNQLFRNFERKAGLRSWHLNQKFWTGAAAAIAIFIMSTAVYVYWNHTSLKDVKKISKISDKILPGKNIAMLTLANGDRVPLESFKANSVISQGSVKINKTANGQLLYLNAGGHNPVTEGNSYNSIETPRAGQYEVVLGDGTKVWLNAQSSLKYPVAFKGKDRSVQLTGEAYFEVAHDKDKPFKVLTGTQTVTVLGTHFNIKAYNDDNAISTTLLQGSVRVADSRSPVTVILTPGKRAKLLRENAGISIANANIDQAIAWKNGYFIFDDQDIQSMMKLISRWYDVDVEYKLHKSERFGGTFSRATNLQTLLKNLESLGNTKFTIKERRIIVSN